MGADVIVVEPPGGDHTRTYGPFADDVESPEHSLWWWHYNTSKRGVVLDLDTPDGAASSPSSVRDADIVLEGEDPGRLAALGLDHAQLRDAHPELIWVSITPFGRTTSRANEPATDLTVLAGGGPAWSCGYDDHTIPPVRGGGNQAAHMAGMFAVMTTLTALLAKDVTGRGQHIDVNMTACANVTTEAGSYMWHTDKITVQRQTGRHATPVLTMPSAGALQGRALRQHRLPAAQRQGVRGPHRLARHARAHRRVPRRRAARSSAWSAAACR